MPPIGTTLVDTTDVAVLRAWIEALGQRDGGAPTAGAGDPHGNDAGAYDAGELDAGEYDGGFSDAETSASPD